MANNIDDHNKIVETSGNFRDYLIPHDHPRLHPSDRDARKHAQDVLGNENIFLVPVARGWLNKYNEPYRGFTSDGKVQHGIWHHQGHATILTKGMVEAARQVLESATATEAAKFRYPVNAREWRSWSNPEVIIVDSGLRLEDMNSGLRDAVYGLLKASLSPTGFEKVVTAMRMNAFLGQLTKLTNVMNEHSYHFCLFGEPALDRPFGFNLFGHHVCLNVFSLNGEVVIGPAFLGAEPNVIDEGPYAGLEVLNKEEAAGLTLMKSLSMEHQQIATIKGDINDIDGSTMDAGQWNPADLRGLGGAFQDNRVVPYAGLRATEMYDSQQKALLRLVAIFHELLPEQAHKLFMQRVTEHLSSTYFAWIGPVNDTSPFYFRIHSPVVMCEFDHHNGVWLANALPKKYHIHTIMRLPNRGDYGTALYDEWRAQHGGDDKL